MNAHVLTSTLATVSKLVRERIFGEIVLVIVFICIYVFGGGAT